MAPNTKDPINGKYNYNKKLIFFKLIFFFLARQISEANRNEMLSVFSRYAHHEHLGEPYMTPQEFLQDYLGYLKGDDIDPTTLNILASLVDLNKDQSTFYFL
jgi:recombinational DNA repair protein (RecF pathway)